MLSQFCRNVLRRNSTIYNLNCKKKLSDRSKLVEQKIDYFLVLDFEATCDRDKQPIPMEIIEFPVLKMNAHTFEIESIFHKYVKPQINPILSPFCVELTNILQETVDDAEDFQKVLADFKTWMMDCGLVNAKDVPLEVFAFVTYGDSDLKKILPQQCKALNITPPSYMREWIDVRKSYTDGVNNTWPSGQTQLLAQLKLEPIGQSHSGINDAFDLANIVAELALRGHVFSINSFIQTS